MGIVGASLGLRFCIRRTVFCWRLSAVTMENAGLPCYHSDCRHFRSKKNSALGLGHPDSYLSFDLDLGQTAAVQ